MTELDLHCQIDEKAFSWTLFLTRLFIGSVLAYTVIGCLLYYRGFLYNAAALGVPMPVTVGIGLLVVQLLLSLMLLLGWFTRVVSGLSVLGAVAVGFVFFAGELNRIYVALIVLLITALLPSVLLGPGKISLDYKNAQRRANQTFRG
jgi:uncharacterized membrane protein YphA (DoxX/SURF4 family)